MIILAHQGEISSLENLNRFCPMGDMKMLKIENVKNVYINSKAVTTFSVYELRDNAWVYDYSSSVDGHWKKSKTVATKHCQENGRSINLDDWIFG